VPRNAEGNPPEMPRLPHPPRHSERQHREESSEIPPYIAILLQTKTTHNFMGTNVPSYYNIFPLSITDKSKEFIKNLLCEMLLTMC
jgi:hypothetical protein